MSDIAIKVENLGKLYRLGEIGTGTISHDLNRWFARIRGKEDPFSKIGESNDRTTKSKSKGDYVWALQDIDFEVKKGEALGLIGRNGAGKSTLLKLLSKVTQPSVGQIKVNGRIASLLEVGTGFHPEMTGRENIFLNGAIMGMTKKEIRKKFDEIVDFAGVERYVDTPVKRYSSGMYVRLAFAVAAHLESEILIVDEVLAVGDAEFQKKCLGKMGDVSRGEGRTVIFVSHNMGAIQSLTNQCVFLNNGKLEKQDTTDKVIKYYLEFTNKQLASQSSEEVLEQFRRSDCKNSNVKIRKILVNGVNVVMASVKMESEVHIQFDIEVMKFEEAFNLAIVIYNQDGTLCQTIYSIENDFIIRSINTGLKKITIKIPTLYFTPGKYFATIQINPMTFSRTSIDCIVEYPLFEVVYQPKNEFEVNRGFGVINQKQIAWNLE